MTQTDDAQARLTQPRGPYRPRHARPDARPDGRPDTHATADSTWFPALGAPPPAAPDWRIGSRRAVEIARRLATLGPQWRLVRPPQVGHHASDVEHLVIGPAGVFTIVTKQHLDAAITVDGESVSVDGYEQPYVEDSRSEARLNAHWLSERARFDVDVRALLVLNTGGSVTIDAQPADAVVHVLTRREIVPHLWSLPSLLGEPSIERIHDVARAQD